MRLALPLLLPVSLALLAAPAAPLPAGDAAVGGRAQAVSPASPHGRRQPQGHPDLMAAFHAARYSVNPELKLPELGGKRGLVAYSRKQQVRAIFSPDGVRVQATSGSAKSRPTVRLTAAAIGRGADLHPLPAAAPMAKANRVEYARGPVTEWYLNDERGLEQGFSIAECGMRNAGCAEPIGKPKPPLVLSLAVSGELRPEGQADGQSVVFRDAAGRSALNYSGLRSWDATGRALPSRMSVPTPNTQHPTPNTLQFIVNDTDALYPLTIDPLFTASEQQLIASDPAGDDDFGFSVGVSGDTAVVGSPRDEVDMDSDRGSAYVFVREGDQWTLQQQLIGNTSGSGDFFGYSVAISGDTVAVGSIFRDVGGDGDQGAVYVFTRAGGVWTQQAEVSGDDSDAAENFGWSVALDGDTIVAGSPNHAVNGNPGQGAAYVFFRSGSVWTQQGRLLAIDGASGDSLGWSVGVSGDTAVAGAPLDTVGANGGQGSVYAFKRTGAVWSQQQRLVASGGLANDNLGISVAISGDTVASGAYLDDVGTNTNQGSVRVFQRSGVSWSQQAQLLAADGADSDFFGYAVALSGNTVLVGDHLNDVGGNGDQGSAYVFTRSGTAWSQQAQLFGTNPGPTDNFGVAVALSGNTAVVGAYRDDTAAADSGSAQVFDVVSGESELLEGGGEPGDEFGASVAISGNYAVVGAPGDFIGSALVFVRSGGAWTFQAQLLADDGEGPDFFGKAVAIDGDTIVVGAAEDNVTEINEGSAYVFVRNGIVWSQQAQLVGPNPINNGLFGSSVAIEGDRIAVGAHGHQAGKVYVFTRSAGAWSQEGPTLLPSNGVPSDQFGTSVALRGDVLLVGARNHAGVGRAYVFALSGGSWSEQAQLFPPDGGASDRFGTSVAMSDKAALVGSPEHDTDGNENQGAAYVFVSNGAAWNLEAKLVAADEAASDLFGRYVAIDGDHALVGANGRDVGTNTNQGAAYLFQRSGGLWTQQAKVVASNGSTDDERGESVAMSADTLLIGSRKDDVNGNANQGSVHVLELTPYAPEQLAAKAVNSHRIDLSWIDSSGLEDGFEIEIALLTGQRFLLADAIKNRVAAQVDNLLPSTLYSFRVRAYNQQDKGAWSDWVAATTLAPPPAAPSGLLATANAANQLLLRWTDNASSETGVHLQRSTDGLSWTQILDGTSNTIQFTDTGLTAGATYHYRVRAYNAAGVSAWNEATGVVRPGTPAAPTVLRAVVLSSTQILLSWRDNATNEKAYYVEAHSGNGIFAAIAILGVDQRGFPHLGLVANTTWTYRVRAHNDAGFSLYTNEITATTLPNPPPIPTGLAAAAVSNRLISVTWNNIANETEYRLERRTGAGPFAQIAVIVADGTSYFDAAVSPSTAYTYRMRAANTGGASNYTVTAGATTPAGATDGLLEVRPGRISFGKTAPGTTATRKLTLLNKGNSPLRVVVGTLASPFAVVGKRDFRLKPRETRVVQVRYAAPEGGGGATATLTIGHSGKRSPVVVVPVSARGG